MKVSRRDNLDRYYLFSLFGFALFAHKIHHSDDVFHNHPWPAFSIIFGSYTEQLFGGRARVKRWFNFVGSRHHKVTITKPVWTLFFHLRRTNQWTVLDDSGNVIATEPWRGVGGPTSYRG